ncbi:MAG: Redox-sensitive transcriptional activator SoxR [uncultured Sphingomonadaceae bacterium]|uniref:Redox-sensitive transcriptional activator SoxR n=1 Tax=uncultured Sphingomonadaceae bacterium TaxID=169976 RepID=A0A6J4T1D4_9SPHN|nr:MAG: Redox-sensitive transcriptional activator SoxR [uncultured Sphingomonadaceae bacterium]
MVRPGPLPKILSVGELARRSGVSVSALHFYEREGLIEGWRSAGNQRRYDRATLRRVAIIKVAQAIGIPLAEIKARLASVSPGRSGWTRLAEEWRSDLDRRIDLLSRLKDQLDGCIGCGCLSVDDCPLRNPEDQMAAGGPGPRHLIS